jgi:hypothetical protein
MHIVKSKAPQKKAPRFVRSERAEAKRTNRAFSWQVPVYAARGTGNFERGGVLGHAGHTIVEPRVHGCWSRRLAGCVVWIDGGQWRHYDVM